MRVCDTSAGKSISAYVILDRKGKYVGKILAHHGGKCSVELWDFTVEVGSRYQTGSASGYGYDKFTAALSGMTFAGFTLSDHCGTSKDTDRAMKEYRALQNPLTYSSDVLKALMAKWEKRAVRFANWRNGEGYGDAYLVSGLDALKCRGYQVIQAI